MLASRSRASMRSASIVFPVSSSCAGVHFMRVQQRCSNLGSCAMGYANEIQDGLSLEKNTGIASGTRKRIFLESTGTSLLLLTQPG